MLPFFKGLFQDILVETLIALNSHTIHAMFPHSLRKELYMYVCIYIYSSYFIKRCYPSLTYYYLYGSDALYFQKCLLRENDALLKTRASMHTLTTLLQMIWTPSQITASLSGVLWSGEYLLTVSVSSWCHIFSRDVPFV